MEESEKRKVLADCDKMSDGIGSVRDKSSSYDDLYDSILEEMEEMKVNLYLRIETIAEDMKKRKNGLDRFFHKLFTSAVSLEEAITCENQEYFCRNIGSKWIFINRCIINEDEFDKTVEPEFAKKERDNEKNFYENMQNIHEESSNHNDKYVKPYGDSWFSPKAHMDIKEFTREYRKLAVKYHPDNNPDAAAVFLDIQQERADILEKL